MRAGAGTPFAVHSPTGGRLAGNMIGWPEFQHHKRSGMRSQLPSVAILLIAGLLPLAGCGEPQGKGRGIGRRSWPSRLSKSWR